MITETPLRVADLLDAISVSVAQSLGGAEPLSLAEQSSVDVDMPLQYAVLAPLGGAVTGEIALFVDDRLAAGLSAAGLDLGTALQPILADVARTTGSIAIGAPQAIDGRLALSRVGGHPASALVPLHDGTTIRAAVAVGMEAEHRPPAPITAPSGDRLDLLRGVEMAATVELGRARMTINDLLGLRDGTIIELDRAAGDAADLFVNGRLIARGEIVVVDENYALRITQIVSDEPGR